MYQARKVSSHKCVLGLSSIPLLFDCIFEQFRQCCIFFVYSIPHNWLKKGNGIIQWRKVKSKVCFHRAVCEGWGEWSLRSVSEREGALSHDCKWGQSFKYKLTNKQKQNYNKSLVWLDIYYFHTSNSANSKFLQSKVWGGDACTLAPTPLLNCT